LVHVSSDFSDFVAALTRRPVPHIVRRTKYSGDEGTLVDEDELIEAALRVVPLIGRRMHAIFAHHPITAGRPPGQMRALFHLYHHERATVGEVAQALGVSMPTASEMIDKLVEDGLAERGVNPSDRRQVLVWLTPKAQEFATRLHATRRAQLRRALDQMAPEERPVFVRSLQAFAQALELEPEQLPECPVVARKLPGQPIVQQPSAGVRSRREGGISF
jgi:DNA-binding MarR family transcriptional regulator